MFEFTRLCSSVEKMSHGERTALLDQKSYFVLNDLEKAAGSREKAVEIFLAFTLSSIAADGRIKESEYEYLRPVFEAAAGRKVEYPEATEMFRDAGLDVPNAYQGKAKELGEQIGGMPEEIKSDMVVLCLIVCSIDGRISGKERRWIKRLCDF